MMRNEMLQSFEEKPRTKSASIKITRFQHTSQNGYGTSQPRGGSRLAECMKANASLHATVGATNDAIGLKSSPQYFGWNRVKQLWAAIPKFCTFWFCQMFACKLLLSASQIKRHIHGVCAQALEFTKFWYFGKSANCKREFATSACASNQPIGCALQNFWVQMHWLW